MEAKEREEKNVKLGLCSTFVLHDANLGFERREANLLKNYEMKEHSSQNSVSGV
jgi:hypothetical protein